MRVTALGLALAAWAGGCGWGHPVKMLRESRPSTGRAALKVSTVLPAGEIRIERLATRDLYEVQLSYCTTHFQAHSRFLPQPSGAADPEGDRLEVIARAIGREPPGPREPNLLLLKLPIGRPLDLTVATGGGADLDLTALSLRRLTVHGGTQRLRVHCKAGNPTDLEQLRFVAGTGEVALEGLGWAAVRSLEFHGGAGRAVVSFAGAGPAEAAALLDPGTGGVEVLLPKDLGVTVSGRDLDATPPIGFRSSGKGWESLNRSAAERHLRVVLDGAGAPVSWRWLP